MSGTDLNRISAIVLAAGQSKRMGQNKLLLPVHGQALLLRTLDLVASLGFGEAILVTSEETARAVQIPNGFVLAVNEHPENGQSSSVRLGMNAASLDYYMFFPADMPLLDKSTVLKIIAEIEAGKIIVPYAGENPASPVIFHKKFRRELLELQGDKGGRAVIANHKADCKTVVFADETAFQDVDTPEEYKNILDFEQ